MNPMYGTVDEADTYFASRLHEFAWTAAKSEDKPKALIAATKLIDSLRFKGSKTDPDQETEYPRNDEGTVPEAIRVATYEIAHSLLEGKDPEYELEQLAIQKHTYASVSTTYSRDQMPSEHIVNGIPSAQAWRWLRPLLEDEDAIRLNRVS